MYAYSKWPEIFRTVRTTANASISLLRQVCAKYGVPETLVSDDGTCFASAEFKNFSAENGIKCVFSPPYHTRSNGKAERFIDTFRRSLHKFKEEGTLVNGKCWTDGRVETTFCMAFVGTCFWASVKSKWWERFWFERISEDITTKS